MNRQVLAVVAGFVVLFGAALGVSFVYIGHGTSRGSSEHRVPSGQTMTVDTHATSSGSTMTGMAMP